MSFFYKRYWDKKIQYIFSLPLSLPHSLSLYHPSTSFNKLLKNHLRLKIKCDFQTSGITNYGPVHTQYCDKKKKKTFFIQYFFSCEICKLKILISVYLNRFWNVTTIFWQKNIFLSQYLCIFLSRYCVQKYYVWIGPIWKFSFLWFRHLIF